jgi:hypothetical protein
VPINAIALADGEMLIIVNKKLYMEELNFKVKDGFRERM